ERRARLLYAFLGVIEQARQEIGTRLTALPELVTRLTADCPELSDFFGHIGRVWTREDYSSFSGAWREALYPLELSAEDKALLSEAGGTLGRYDAGTQAAALKRAGTALERQYEAALASARRNGKVYRILGFAAGIMAVILIL
ncbi:MAG: stage III sporulation protein AB, partial [Oscillospiraceae bacterium]|nr:stage III sporulation protein AB [Oscillospiraceae bacterium]